MYWLLMAARNPNSYFAYREISYLYLLIDDYYEAERNLLEGIRPGSLAGYKDLELVRNLKVGNFS